MNISYETSPPKLTLTLLEKKHIPTIYKNLESGKFVLYLLGREQPLSSSDIRRYEGSSIISFTLEEFPELPGSNPEGISEGTLLVTNNGGEATAIDLSWVTGVKDAAVAYEAFLAMPRSQQKSFIHPRLLQNLIVK